MRRFFHELSRRYCALHSVSNGENLHFNLFLHQLFVCPHSPLSVWFMTYNCRLVYPINLWIWKCICKCMMTSSHGNNFSRYWLFVKGIHGPPVDPLTKTCDVFLDLWTDSWIYNRNSGDLRCHRAHYDVEMSSRPSWLLAFDLDICYWFVVNDYHGVCAIRSLPAQSGLCRHPRTLPAQ